MSERETPPPSEPTPGGATPAPTPADAEPTGAQSYPPPAEGQYAAQPPPGYPTAPPGYAAEGAPARGGVSNGLLIAGWILAVAGLLIPFVAIGGLVIGIIVLVKGNMPHGIGMIVASIVCAIIGAIIGVAVTT